MPFKKRENLNSTRSSLVVVGSKNPVKIACTAAAFAKGFGSSFLVEGVNAASGVADQPQGEAETLLGAQNRVRHAQTIFPEADYWVGLEGGVAEDEHGMYAFAWILVRHTSGKSSQAKTGSFYLPNQIAELIRGGMELGHADDLVFKAQNSKQQGGSVGLLTHGLVTRETYYEQALLLALIPFLNEELYPA
jgi:inosine/xanthosine triphosphatase